MMEPEDSEEEMGGDSGICASQSRVSDRRRHGASAAQKELVEDTNPPPACLRDDQWATLDETEGAGLGIEVEDL